LHLLITWLSLISWKIALLVTACSALHEVFCVAFIFYAERKKAYMTGVVAMIAGQMSVASWLLSINNNFYVPFLIIGWGIGATLGVMSKIGK